MSLQRDAKTLSLNSIASLRRAMSAFNSYDDDGRTTSVLLHLQHSAEMLLKAVLCQNRVRVFDKDTSRSLGFEKCLGICQAHHDLKESEAGIFRAVDALRDAAQHWIIVVSEDLLYMNTRAIITAYDAYLKRSLDLDVSSHIPPRVLPVSTKPPGDFDFLVDREYKLIAELLQPGKRQRDEARARVRSLLAMEAIVTEKVEVSERDIDRIEKAIKDGKEFNEVFPRLNTVGTATTGEGTTFTVHFSKKEGAPVKYIKGDDPEGHAAVREVDLRKKFHMLPSDLAKKLGLTEPKSKALRQHLNIDSDPDCHWVFEFGKSKHGCFSDNARNKMKAALDGGLDMNSVWEENRPGKRKAIVAAVAAVGEIPGT
ncbi:hypothetical protein J2X72_001431 [Phyllobacterium sp. 1468]|uniref:hypothetical protein n=1 Tax=Phyllobacterium sp. 1468 TaxID=2817759 RepID=UPI00285FDA64|nr:hypothetical protein [Phyllobacterium sp. 1468]MDR6632647.1 hypothetical protein [Phyllobacterium sp. 1468]